jgi:hypothetical protein
MSLYRRYRIRLVEENINLGISIVIMTAVPFFRVLCQCRLDA